MKFTFGIAIVALCLFGFQNCAGGNDVGIMSQVQQIFPKIQAIQPHGNVSVANDVVHCQGACEVTFSNGVILSGSFICDGSLVVSNDKLTCDNNLSLSR